MKLIIELDEDLKSAIYNCGLFLNPTDKLTLINAINNGTPLPKGHGRLIDADYFREDSIFDIIPFAQRMNIECVVDHAPTIIEADIGE